MAILAVLPTDNFAFSDVIAFFNRDNPTAPTPFQAGRQPGNPLTGNFPPTGGVGAQGFGNVVYPGTASWPDTNPPLQGDTDGLAWAAKTTDAGPGVINIAGRSLTFGQITVYMTVNGSAGLATGFDVTVRIYEGTTRIRENQGTPTAIFTADVADGRVAFTLGDASATTTIQDGGSFQIDVHSPLTTGWSYEITGLQMPVSLAGGQPGVLFFPTLEHLSWYNRGGGIVPTTAEFSGEDLTRTYRPNTLVVNNGDFAIKERIQDTSSTQSLTPFGTTWPSNVANSVAAIYFIPTDPNYDAIETFFGVTYNGNVQSLLGFFIQFTHPGGTATYEVTSIRAGVAELWVQFRHDSIRSQTGVPPADGTATTITLIDSGSGEVQQINAGVSNDTGTVRLSSLRNVNDGVL